MNKLAFSRAHYQAVKLRVCEGHPDLDEETLADTVEGLTDLQDIVAAILRSAVTDEALGKGLRSRISDMQERLSRLEDRASKRRQIARDVMVEADIKKITAPDLTVSIRAGTPAVVITDESLVPPQYWEPRDPRLNRQSLAVDLKSGQSIEGAILGNPEPILSVRVK